MHQSIPGAPMAPPPGYVANPWELACFCLEGKFTGAGTLELPNAQSTINTITLQHFPLITQTDSAF